MRTGGRLRQGAGDWILKGKLGIVQVGWWVWAGPSKQKDGRDQGLDEGVTKITEPGKTGHLGVARAEVLAVDQNHRQSFHKYSPLNLTPDPLNLNVQVCSQEASVPLPLPHHHPPRHTRNSDAQPGLRTIRALILTQHDRTFQKWKGVSRETDLGGSMG